MDVKDALQSRRAYRSLDPVPIPDDLVWDLAESARLFCSCFNNQPWRYVFVPEPKVLEELKGALSRGNEWARDASMIIAVCSKPQLDCQIKGRDYYLFDTGMATAALILRATELGLVAHPIAGYDEAQAKEVLGVPDDVTVIALVIVGKHAASISPVLSEKQITAEKERPERLPLPQFAYLNRYSI
jgi:nitroreductase